MTVQDICLTVSLAARAGLSLIAPTGLCDIKLIGEPWWIEAGGTLSRPDLQIRFRGYDRLAG